MKTPDWWIFALLALAVFRVFRLIAEDTILDRPRKWLLRGPLDTWEKEGDDPGDDYRLEWGIFITCPWCLGFWLSGVALILYSLIVEWVGVFSFLVCWFALSAVVGLVAKNWDADE
jgi:hypothetical protein